MDLFRVEGEQNGDAMQERLDWFVRVRWAAFAGQAIVYLYAVAVLGLTLPPTVFFIVEAALGVSNILISRHKRNFQSPSMLGIILLCDVMLLTILLARYGGHANPFSMVYLVHVVLAALFIGHRWTWGVAIFSTLCFSALFPLADSSIAGRAHHHVGDGSFDLHLQGMLIAFVMLSFLIAGLVSRMRISIDRREHEILRRRASEERLAALTQLAAGAAHELGTPLATAGIVVAEIIDQLPHLAVDQIGNDLECVREQLDRCAAILRGMAPQAGESVGETPISCGPAQVGDRVRELLPPPFAERLMIQIDEKIGQLLMPLESVSQALSALAKNAFEASAVGSPVTLTMRGGGDTIRFEVSDRGEGMEREVLKKLGEPFFTTKDPGKGTGLGIFLCRLLVSRLEGVIHFQSARGQGTEVSIEIPMRVNWKGAR